MRSLLSERDHRIILILEILMTNNWVSLTTMTKYLNCSEKTIRNDLGSLSAEFDEILIESSPQLGYHLVRHNAFPIENTVDQIINNTLIFQLLQLLLENSNLKLTELETLLFVSSNSIRNVVKGFNKQLKKDNVSIKSRPFRIEGDETKITSLYFIRLQQSYFSRSIVEDKIFSYIKELIPALFLDNPVLKKNYEHDVHSLNILLYIRFFREKNGHSVETNTSSPIIDYQILQDKETIKGFYKLFHVPLNNELINRVVSFILAKNTASSYLQLVYMFEHSHEFVIINHFLTSLTTQMSETLKISPLTHSQLKELIKPKPVSSNQNNFNYQQHLTLLHILKYEQKKLLDDSQRIKYKAFCDTTLLIQFAYLLEIDAGSLVTQLHKQTRPMRIAVRVVSDTYTKKLFKEYFNYHFKHFIVFDFSDTPALKANYDLLITNTFDYHQNEQPVLNIAGLPNEYLHKNILKLYTDFSINHYLGTGSEK